MALASQLGTDTVGTDTVGTETRAPTTAGVELGSLADSGALTQAVETIAAFVSAFEPDRYSGSDAVELTNLGARIERLGGAIKTLAATRAADAHCHRATGHRSPGQWLASLTGESMGDALSTLRLGEQLTDQPGVENAFRSGKLSKVRATTVAGAVKINPRAEGELLRVAQGPDTLRQLRDRCLHAKAQGRSKQDEAAHYEQLRAARYCRTWTDHEDGAFRLDARLTPDVGAKLLASLGPESDRVFHLARRSGRKETPDCYRADALVNLVTGEGGGGSGDRWQPGGPKSGSSKPGGGSKNRLQPGGSRSTVHIRVDLDALRNGSVSGGQICEIPGIGPIPVETARDLMGDALCKLVITNGVDVPTICNLGRHIPRAVMDALIERDPTCVVPGCGVAAHLEVDHWQLDFAQGGPTRWSNLARLCHFHHQLKTTKGFRLEGGPGNWRWVGPPPRRDPHAPSHPGWEPDPPDLDPPMATSATFDLDFAPGADPSMTSRVETAIHSPESELVSPPGSSELLDPDPPLFEQME
jgi:hypothetical protein